MVKFCVDLNVHILWIQFFSIYRIYFLFHRKKRENDRFLGIDGFKNEDNPTCKGSVDMMPKKTTQQISSPISSSGQQHIDFRSIFPLFILAFYSTPLIIQIIFLFTYLFIHTITDTLYI